QCLLKDTKDGSVTIAIARKIRRAQIEAATQPAPFGEFVRLPLNGGVEAEVIEDRRAELRRDVLYRPQHSVDEQRHRLHAFRLRSRLLLGQPGGVVRRA